MQQHTKFLFPSEFVVCVCVCCEEWEAPAVGFFCFVSVLFGVWVLAPWQMLFLVVFCNELQHLCHEEPVWGSNDLCMRVCLFGCAVWIFCFSVCCEGLKLFNIFPSFFFVACVSLIFLVLLFLFFLCAVSAPWRVEAPHGCLTYVLSYVYFAKSFGSS